jgi:signal transduction histidine kinase
MSAGPPAREGAPRHEVPVALLHDLRTPLGQIIGYSEMLVEQAHEAGHAGLVPDLQKMGAAAYRMVALLEDSFAGVHAPEDGAPGDDGTPPPGGRVGGLAEFILSHREPIMAEWEAFARTCTPASAPMGIEALRDHASEMLTVIARDLGTPQDRGEQAAKSLGNAPDDGAAEPTAAEEHGAGRAESGFTMEQMVSEYRALRASVIRLWTRENGEITPADVEDLTRFNEAVDQSLAESVSRYTLELDHSKEMFLAILGHDLRTPLGVVYTSSRFMLETEELQEPHLTLTTRIASSATRMVNMVGDLLDFTRSRLGGGIPVTRAPMNMGKVVHDVVDEMSAAHPARTIRVDARGELQGDWDCPRISQVISNLLGNALEHGAEGMPVKVEVGGDDDEVTIAVHNDGPPIPGDRLNGIFNPMKPRQPEGRSAASGPTGNLGLGLYIADRIVHAHAGTIDVDSTARNGTTFTVHLPRREH